MHKPATALLSIGVALAALSFAESAHATNYSIWIHGRNTGGTPSGWSYWSHSGYGGQGIATGVNAQPANYDGTQHISVSNPNVNNVLDTYCKAGSGNSCYVACHSAGCAQIGYS